MRVHAASARLAFEQLTLLVKESAGLVLMIGCRAVLTEGYRKCKAEVLRQCHDILKKRLGYAADDPDSFLDAAQNARLIASAERYYRIMYYGGAESWNLRDTHMFETLSHILDAHGSPIQGRGLGAQFPYWRCALYQHGRGP